jgi:hypothetical protein
MTDLCLYVPIHNFDPKILLEGSAKLRWGGGGRGLVFQSLCGPVERQNPLGLNRKQSSAAATGKGAAQRPVLYVNELGRTGAQARPKPTSIVRLQYLLRWQSFLYFTVTKHNKQTCYELFHLLAGCTYVTASSSLYLILTLYSYGFVSAQTNR